MTYGEYKTIPKPRAPHLAEPAVLCCAGRVLPLTYSGEWDSVRSRVLQVAETQAENVIEFTSELQASVDRKPNGGERLLRL